MVVTKIEFKALLEILISLIEISPPEIKKRLEKTLEELEKEQFDYDKFW